MTPYDTYKRLNNMKSLIKESVRRLKVMASYWKTKKAILLVSCIKHHAIALKFNNSTNIVISFLRYCLNTNFLFCLSIVGLFKADSGSKPFIIDRSPPIVGFVIDGKIHFRDITYQSSNKEICVQWTGFHDPESGIDQ